MKALGEFLIPIHRLKEGLHVFEFDLDGAFFAKFEESLIDESSLDVTISLHRKSDLLLLLMDYKGYMVTECDRCAETIHLPLEGQNKLLVKFSDVEMTDDEAVMYLPTDAEELNVAPILYEVISLSIPIVKKYDCEEDKNRPCNREVLNYLNQPKTEEKDSSVWDELKKLEF